MIEIIRHRGPDATGVFMDDDLCMGHARLSIIGLKTGNQPIGNEDSTLWIVYNGEVFNYLELKSDLVKKGHLFRTDTDTEVLLHLYEEYGPRCLEMMNGQFAFAVWDSRRKTLFLARDRVGIRPLYYTHINGRMLFASEIKALFVNDDSVREVDPRSLFQVFTFWTTLSPRTLFKGVFEVPPGHYMVVKDGHMEQHAYWRLPRHDPQGAWPGSLDDAAEELFSLLKDAVRLRLRADVPVGSYLSGGMDSSIITSLISRHFSNHLKTFSVGFQQDSYDETSFQDHMVRFLGTDHHRILVSNRDIRAQFPRVVWHAERPLLRTAPVPLLALSGLVRDRRIKVVLTGEGADEVFFGYNIFKEAKVRRFWARQPESQWRPLLLERLYPYVFERSGRGHHFLRQFFSVQPSDLTDPFFSHRIRWRNGEKNTGFFSKDMLDQLSGYQPWEELNAILPPDFESWDCLSKAQLLEMNIFLSNYLLSSQGDRVAMAHSLEIRVPFLDHRVIEFAARLPLAWKLKGLNEKFILKHAFRGHVPETIRKRKKQPYRAPIAEVFFDHDSDGYVQELLSKDELRKTPYFNAAKVARLVGKYSGTGRAQVSETQDMAVAGILSTQLLHRQFIEDFPGKDVKPVRPDVVVRI
jgi:asparagine synthase (glutamine-hydrolysing)